MTVYRNVRALRQCLLPIAVFAACRGPNDPMPATAAPMEPPRVYRLWWAITERCSAIKADFDAIKWYLVRGTSTIEVNGKSYHGYAWPETGRIVLAERAVLNGAFVRHEMLHALTGYEHTRKYFVEQCGGVVSCEGECLTEAGEATAPPADAPEVAATELDVTVRVDPPHPSLQRDSGWVAITVTAANSRAHAVWARVAPVASGERAAATFGFVSNYVSTGTTASEYAFIEASRVGFSSGQTRQLVFDRQFSPGDYFLRGFFNVDTTAAMRLTVSP